MLKGNDVLKYHNVLKYGDVLKYHDKKLKVEKLNSQMRANIRVGAKKCRSLGQASALVPMTSKKIQTQIQIQI